MAKLPKASKDDCKEPGVLRPSIDRNKCEGKSACVDVCPYDVFSVRRIDPDDYRFLSAFACFKVWAHGMKTAYTPNADACRACGLCVVACPESAITLTRSDLPAR